MDDYRLGIEMPDSNFNIDIWDNLLFSKEKIEYAFLHFEMGDDPNALYQNYKYAKRNGYKVGVVTNLQSGDVDHAKQEADILLSNLSPIKLDLPIFLNIVVRVGATLDTLDQTDASKVLLSFCETIEAYSSYKAGICAREYYYVNRIDFNMLYMYDIWYDSPGETYHENNANNFYLDIAAYGRTNHFLFGDHRGISTDIVLIQFYKDYFPKNPYGIKHWYLVNRDDNTTDYRYFDTPDHYISNDWVGQHGKWFYFNQIGFMVKNIWYHYNGKWYYIDQDGVLNKDPIKTNKNVHDTLTYNSALKYHGLLKGLI